MAGPTQKETQAEAESPGEISTGTPGSEKSRVFIVDDHTMFREGLRQLIDQDGARVGAACRQLGPTRIGQIRMQVSQSARLSPSGPS